MDRKVEQIAREDYPETAFLQQVKGVGPLIALTFILTLDDKARFQKSRDVGCYAGLRPRRSESGESQPQLRITKEGDAYLRKTDLGICWSDCAGWPEADSWASCWTTSTA
jgi:transposase